MNKSKLTFDKIPRVKYLWWLCVEKLEDDTNAKHFQRCYFTFCTPTD